MPVSGDAVESCFPRIHAGPPINSSRHASFRRVNLRPNLTGIVSTDSSRRLMSNRQTCEPANDMRPTDNTLHRNLRDGNNSQGANCGTELLSSSFWRLWSFHMRGRTCAETITSHSDVSGAQSETTNVFMFSNDT